MQQRLTGVVRTGCQAKGRIEHFSPRSVLHGEHCEEPIDNQHLKALPDKRLFSLPIKWRGSCFAPGTAS